MDMYSKVLIGQRTHPFGVLKLSTGSALTAAHFCQTAAKVSKKALPLRTAFAALKFPRSGPAPWARRDGPSMAQHGSPGIHAGRPTPQNLHSASRWGGRSRSRSKARSRSTATAVKNPACKKYPANWQSRSPLPHTPACSIYSARQWYWPVQTRPRHNAHSSDR